MESYNEQTRGARRLAADACIPVMDASEIINIIREDIARAETELPTKHTPGPWRNRHWNQYGQIEIHASQASFRASDEPKGCIARVFPREQAPEVERGPDNVNECEANARLIAAAPDLLDACGRARNFLLCSGPELAKSYAVDMLNAAIAKATGKGEL